MDWVQHLQKASPVAQAALPSFLPFFIYSYCVMGGNIAQLGTFTYTFELRAKIASRAPANRSGYLALTS